MPTVVLSRIVDREGGRRMLAEEWIGKGQRNGDKGMFLEVLLPLLLEFAGLLLFLDLVGLLFFELDGLETGELFAGFGPTGIGGALDRPEGEVVDFEHSSAWAGKADSRLAAGCSVGKDGVLGVECGSVGDLDDAFRSFEFDEHFVPFSRLVFEIRGGCDFGGLEVGEHGEAFFATETDAADVVAEFDKGGDGGFLAIQKADRKGGCVYARCRRHGHAGFEAFVVVFLCLVFRGGGNASEDSAVNRPAGGLLGFPVGFVRSLGGLAEVGLEQDFVGLGEEGAEGRFG